MEKLKEFVNNFLKAMDNHFLGHSLKKWLAVGTFWLIVVICLMYTDAGNLASIVTILAGLLVTLMGINVADKKINNAATMIPKKDDVDNPVI